jgi:hypothetical protein
MKCPMTMRTRSPKPIDRIAKQREAVLSDSAIAILFH